MARLPKGPVPDLRPGYRHPTPVVLLWLGGPRSSAMVAALHLRGLKPVATLSITTGSEPDWFGGHAQRFLKWFRARGWPEPETVRMTGLYPTLESALLEAGEPPSVYGHYACYKVAKLRPLFGHIQKSRHFRYGLTDIAIPGDTTDVGGENYHWWSPLTSWLVDPADFPTVCRAAEVPVPPAAPACFFCPLNHQRDAEANERQSVRLQNLKVVSELGVDPKVCRSQT